MGLSRSAVAGPGGAISDDESAARPERHRFGVEPGNRALVVLTAAALVASAVWIVAAAVTAGHGLDISDEGFYLVSYRWWDVNLRTFTGVQYLYGPVFELLGFDIARLRLFRLGTVVVTHAALGIAFMRWLRTIRPEAPTTRWWEAAGVAAVLACGGLVYGWLPLSPGYNDVALLGSMLLTAGVLWAARDVHAGIRTRVWVPLLLGFVIVAMALAKWSSLVLTLAVVGTSALVVLLPSGLRSTVRLVVWTLVGVVLAVAAVHVLIIPLHDAIPPMAATNRLVAASFNAPTKLLTLYGVSAAGVVGSVVTGHFLLLLVAAAAAVTRGRRATRVVAWSALAAVAISVVGVLVRQASVGGVPNLTRYPSSLLLVFTVAAVAGGGALLKESGHWQPRSWRWPGWQRLQAPVLYLLLLVVPVAQGLGTGNPVHYLGVNGFACWLAVMIAILTAVPARATVARGLTAAAVAGAVLLATSIGSTGLLWHPYRTPPPAETTAVAKDVPALSSLRLTPETARDYADLHRRLLPWVAEPGRAMMPFDGMAGLVLMLDGRPVGEAWYAGRDPRRSAAGIRSQCPGGEGWWGAERPVLLYGRDPAPVDQQALAACGLDLTRDYRLLAPARKTMDIRVYVPKEHDEDGGS